MLFSSLEFLYLFFPLTTLLCLLLPLRWRNPLLLAVSLLFYSLGEPRYLLLMLLTVTANYGFGLWLSRAIGQGKKATGILWSAVAANLALLGFFKYYDFLASVLSLPTLGLPLPAGISFYTFQAMSYVIDVWRRETEATKNWISFGTYVALYPQLIAGPIVRYTEIDRRLVHPVRSVSGMAEGLSLFCAGLAKKVLFANTAGALCEELLRAGGATPALGVWLWLIFYALQIYYDFSGYSDMARGLGSMLGFDFPENFRHPYIADSITDFWRRWHVTLSAWFRSYVYIPLGGNRRGKLRTYRNLLVTWLLTGLWHGAAWNFLLWGIYFFLLLALEKAVLLPLLARLPRPIRQGYALLFILFGWLIFSAKPLSLFGNLVGAGGVGFTDGRITYELLRNLPLLALMVLGCTPLPHRQFLRLTDSHPYRLAFLRTLLCVASLLLSTAYLVDSSYNPFLYFRF